MSKSVVNSKVFKNMIFAGANKLEKNKELLNALNVFPVPDGDTGTNMSLTFFAAASELLKQEANTVGECAKIVSNGALRGARGNSGVIVSQLFRGIATGLKDVNEANVSDFVNAFIKSKETAYKAVMKPKEGTILTVSSHLAEVSKELENSANDVEDFFTKLLVEGDKIVKQTQEMMPVLKQAGVVDSGAYGYLLILEGMLEGLKNNSDVVLEKSKEVKEGVSIGADFGQIKPEDIEFGYCTEFFIILEKENPNVETVLKKSLSKIGDSIVVVADETIVKIHVHTNNPGVALEEALKFGSLDNLKIENMRIQHSNLSGGVYQEEVAPYKDTAIVAVSSGDGLTNIFKNLGCDSIISGGQSMNPSSEDLCTAIEKINANNIIILPNNSNIILAAEQVKDLIKDKKIFVVPTKTIPQGINCLVSYMPSENIDEVLENLNASIGNIQSGSITHAVRDTEMDGLKINEGDYLLLHNNKIINTSKNLVDGGVELVESVMNDEEAFVTLYYGQDTTEEIAREIASKLEEKYEDIEVDVQEGGQPIYYFIISIE